MTLHYTLSYADRHDVANALTPQRVRNNRLCLTQALCVLVILSFCIVLIMQYSLVAPAILLLILAYYQLRDAWHFFDIRNYILQVSADNNPGHHIMLEILNDGLHETVNGVVSFVPWASIVRVYKTNGVIIADLASSQHAIIPCSIFAQLPQTPEDIIALIDSHLPKPT